MLTIHDSKAALLAQRAINDVPNLLVGDHAAEVRCLYISANNPVNEGLFSGLRGSHKIIDNLYRALRDGRLASSSDHDFGIPNAGARLGGGTCN